MLQLLDQKFRQGSAGPYLYATWGNSVLLSWWLFLYEGATMALFNTCRFCLMARRLGSALSCCFSIQELSRFLRGWGGLSWRVVRIPTSWIRGSQKASLILFKVRSRIGIASFPLTLLVKAVTSQAISG